MRFVLPASDSREFESRSKQLGHWTYAVVPHGIGASEQCELLHDHWLGCSDRGDVWGLAVDDQSGPGTQQTQAGTGLAAMPVTVVLLVDPPKRDPRTIANLLLQVHVEIARAGDQRPALERILAEAKFPEYLSVADFLPEAPEDWLPLPAELVVAFQLSENACVGERQFQEYRRDSLFDAIRVVCGRRHDGLLIEYNLVAREVVPLLRWNMDGPLSRRGQGEPTERTSVQGDLPWEQHADSTLLSVYQYIPIRGFALAPSYTGKPVVRLRVGGLTPKAAVENWERCAKQLRRLRKKSL